jgi:hypothetical protein
VSRAAFVKAERTRRSERLPTKRQRYTLTSLSRKAGIELPTKVRWRSEASDAIKHLKRYLEQPMLEGWGEASVA